ncbi:MAG: LuxR C-terminal-related transcriptional regulator [Caldilineaceae bacterium]
MRDDLTLNSSKLYQPRVTASLVFRPRLVEQLERGLQRPLTLICAPAGYGKTTLVSSYLSGRSAAWLSLDEQDGDLAVFIRYYCAAIRTLFPGACSHTLALLQAPHPAPLRALVATVGSELTDLPHDFVLVLDDYHTISGTAVPELLAGIARHWPRTLHLVLITRRNPLLPLAGLRAKGQLVEIRMRDLQFTPDEVAQYATSELGEQPGAGVLAQLQQQTEGWIAGLHLALLSRQSQADTAAIAHLTASDTNIAEYLLNEVLGQQPSDIMSFLLQTASLDRFCVPLCEYVVEQGAGDRPAAACIDWLQRTNLLIVALDDRRDWYRYHHLLREFLQLRAAAALPRDQLRGAHQRAAAWFAAHDLVEEAIQHALSGDDLDLAAHMMAQGLCGVLNRQDGAALRRWLNLLPQEFRTSRPWLQIIKGWLQHFSLQTDALAALLQEIELELAGCAATLTTEEVHLLRGNILALRAMAAYFDSLPAASIACAQEALLLLPEQWSFARGSCTFWLGVSGQVNGQGEAFRRLLWARYKAATAKGDNYALATLGGLCQLEFESGRLELASEAAALMLEQSRRSGAIGMQGWGHYWLGQICYEWGDLAAAAAHLHEVTHLRYSLHSYPARGGMAGLARLQCTLGDLSSAEQTLALLHQYDMDTVGYETAETAALRAQLSCLRGDSVSAQRWAAAFTRPVRDEPQPQAYNAHVVKACLLLATGTDQGADQALRLTVALSGVAVRTHNTRLQITLLCVQAMALHAQGCDHEAHTVLAEALVLGEPGGFVRTFVDLGPRLRALLEQLTAGLAIGTHAPAPTYIRRILAAYAPLAHFPQQVHAQHAPDRRPEPLVESLTARELEILALMGKRLSDKEIARTLSLATSTVHRHTANIYAKLGVNRRWDAVVKAQAIGLLSR